MTLQGGDLGGAEIHLGGQGFDGLLGLLHHPGAVTGGLIGLLGSRDSAFGVVGDVRHAGGHLGDGRGHLVGLALLRLHGRACLTDGAGQGAGRLGDCLGGLIDLAQRATESLQHLIQATTDVGDLVTPGQGGPAAQIAPGSGGGHLDQLGDPQAQGLVDAGEGVAQQQQGPQDHAQDHIAQRGLMGQALGQHLGQKALGLFQNLVVAGDHGIALGTQSAPGNHTLPAHGGQHALAEVGIVVRCKRQGALEALRQLRRLARQQPQTLLQFVGGLPLLAHQGTRHIESGRIEAVGSAQAARQAAQLADEIDLPWQSQRGDIDEKEAGVVGIQRQARGGRDVIEEVEGLGQLLIPAFEHLQGVA